MCKYCEQEFNTKVEQAPIHDGQVLVQLIPATPISRRKGIGAVMDIYLQHGCGSTTYKNIATVPIKYCPMCGKELK